MGKGERKIQQGYSMLLFYLLYIAAYYSLLLYRIDYYLFVPNISIMCMICTPIGISNATLQMSDYRDRR